MEPRDIQARRRDLAEALVSSHSFQDTLQLEEKLAFQGCCVHCVLLPRELPSVSGKMKIGAVITIYPCIKGPTGTALRRAIALTAGRLHKSYRAGRGAGES